MAMRDPDSEGPPDKPDVRSLIEDLVIRGAQFVPCDPEGQALDTQWRSQTPGHQEVQFHIERGCGLLGIVPGSIGYAVITVEGGGRKAVNAVKKVLEVETVVGLPTGSGGFRLWFRLPTDGQDMPSRLTKEWDIRDAKGDVRIGADFVLIRKLEHLGVLLAKADRHRLPNSTLLRLTGRPAREATALARRTRSAPSYRTQSGAQCGSLPTFDEWRIALPDLKRRGAQWEGPCPLCGGRNRFHLNRKPDGGALLGCRHCMDGSGQGARFGELLRVVFPNRFEKKSPAASPANNSRCQEQQPRRAHAPASANAPISSLVETIWAQSVKADETPARSYLAKRLTWPPHGTGPDLPDDVRWLDRILGPPDVPELKWYGVPTRAAGAIVFALRKPETGELTAIILEALTIRGDRRDPRWRKAYGKRRGSVFEPQSGQGAIHVVEGEVDALAAMMLPSIEGNATIRSGGGTSGFTLATVQGDHRVVLHPDADPEGRFAAQKLRFRLLAKGRECILDYRQSGDVADELAGLIEERIAIREIEGGQPRSDATIGSWIDFLSECTGGNRCHDN